MPRLTNEFVKRVAPGPGRREAKVYDDQIRGFGIRVTANGSRSFLLNYVSHGRERRITIGAYPAWSVAAAREEAAKLRRCVDAGEDPQAERVEARNQRTVAQLWEQYSELVSSRKAASTQRDERSMWQSLILPVLGSRRLPDLEYADIERLHRDISARTPARANRAIATFRHAMSKAKQWKWVDANPADGIKLNRETPRERFLSMDELDRFWKVLTGRAQTPSVLALRFILLTGCRRGEALTASWDQFDLDAGVWTKPSAHTKQKRAHRVPLSSAAMEVLRLAEEDGNGDLVFPSPITGAPLVEVKKVFRLVCAEASITNLRIHDLRHSYASYLASSGQSLPIIGRLLGHTQASTTNRYAHLLDEPLRAATEIVALATRRSDAEG